MFLQKEAAKRRRKKGRRGSKQSQGSVASAAEETSEVSKFRLVDQSPEVGNLGIVDIWLILQFVTALYNSISVILC